MSKSKPVATKSLPATRLEVWEDFELNNKVYKLTINAMDYTLAQLTDFDYALLHDIEYGKPSKTPIADKLLGLETIVRRIEEAVAQASDMAKLSFEPPVQPSNPQSRGGA